MGTINDNLHVAGALSCTTFNPPDVGIGRTKVVHEVIVRYAQDAGADVATKTSPIHIAYKDGAIVGVEVMCITAPIGGDKAFTVDVKKGNQAGAFATILSSVVTVNSSKADREVSAATLSTTTYSDGDSFEVVVTTSGTTGIQGIGLIVTLILGENPQ